MHERCLIIIHDPGTRQGPEVYNGMHTTTAPSQYIVTGPAVEQFVTGLCIDIYPANKYTCFTLD